MLAALPAQAQTTGGVRGFVHERFLDSKREGPAIPGARVAAIGLAGSATTTADAHGFYVLWGLPPGVYSLRVDADHFIVDAINGWRYICIHAGNQEYVDLTVLQPAYVLWNYDALWRRRFEELRLPSQTQTADLYSIGAC